MYVTNQVIMYFSLPQSELKSEEAQSLLSPSHWNLERILTLFSRPSDISNLHEDNILILVLKSYGHDTDSQGIQLLRYSISSHSGSDTGIVPSRSRLLETLLIKSFVKLTAFVNKVSRENFSFLLQGV